MVKQFVIQWHLTEACNLRCLHCYQEKHVPVQLKFDKLKLILDQYKNLLLKLNYKGHINITGGEPLSSPYFFQMLDEFKKDEKLYSFSILTNGTLINDAKAFKVAKSEKIPMYIPDNNHPSTEGAYLSAACHVRSFFHHDVSGVTEYCDLNDNGCKAMLGVADTIIN